MTPITTTRNEIARKVARALDDHFTYRESDGIERWLPAMTFVAVLAFLGYFALLLSVTH